MLTTLSSVCQESDSSQIQFDKVDPIPKDSIRILIDSYTGDTLLLITLQKGVELVKINAQNQKRKETILITSEKYLTSKKQTAAAQNETKAVMRQKDALTMEVAEERIKNNRNAVRIIELEQQNTWLKKQRAGALGVIALTVGILILR